jgi:hypothetical protein
LSLKCKLFKNLIFSPYFRHAILKFLFFNSLVPPNFFSAIKISLTSPTPNSRSGLTEEVARW